MTVPSDLIEEGTKGKVLTLLHAWKDQLREMGGEQRLHRPRLLQGNPNEEDNTGGEWTDEESKAVAETRSEIVQSGDTPKELSREGAYSRGVHKRCH